MWVYDDGGREKAGYKGQASDCVTRAVAIALQLPYQQVYDELNVLAAKGKKQGASRSGHYRPTYEAFLLAMGWKWTPTMKIGSGCKVHLIKEELPPGRVIASCSRHIVAVIEGIIHDTHDPSREGTRCVYGYYTK